MDLDGYVHQTALVNSPYKYPAIQYFFLIGGYGCGKSFSGVLLILSLYSKYAGSQMRIGIGGISQTLLRKTLLADLFKVLITAGIKFKHNKQEHTFYIGTLEFVYIGMADPSTIFAYNFSVFIGDELDELQQEKAIEAFTAAQERTRILCPDGRQAFSVFTTTAQGLKGTYRIIEDLRDKRIAFVLIRGLTKNNKALDPAYVKRLYDLYTPIEAEAFLEGKFVNLYTGRVYGSFDEATCTIKSTSVPSNATLYVGQDINSGFSKAVVLMADGAWISIVKEYSFEALGDAPVTLRHTFPTQKIIWLPDASAKEVITGYTREMEEYSIECVMRSINPPIVSRILAVNKMFKTGQLKVWDTLKQLPIALKTRQFGDDGMPSKGKGPLSPDHICDATEYAAWYILYTLPQLKDLKELLRIKDTTAIDGE